MPSDQEVSFLTHSKYIHAFQLLVYDPSPLPHQNMYDYLKTRFLYEDMLPQSRLTGIDLGQVRSSLYAAWGTDTLLSMTGRFADEDELLRLSNNWSAIQVYYIFYYCTQALHAAKKQPRPRSHTSTQGLFYDYWGKRRVYLPPWSLAYGASGPKNAPPTFTPNLNVNPWTLCAGDNIWNLACKAIKTTRQRSLVEKRHDLREKKKTEIIKAWKVREAVRILEGKKPRSKKPFPLSNLSNEEKTLLDSELRPFTIMDYLYRVRIKTNYEDSNMFSYGPTDIASSQLIRNAFCTIGSGTLLLHELAIRNLVGRDIFLIWVDEWIQRNMPEYLVNGLRARQPYLI